MASRSASSSSSSRTCMCSPTTHPGSFRCSMHKNRPRSVLPRNTSNYNPHRSDSSKANSLKAILLQIIKPSNQDLHRRKNFQPKPTRFYLMNSNTDPLIAVS
ncbi:uncharacterized protein LOC130725508 [Lotus japonicus]|uniref:uncharacterized protein LOC130725508 n=1 Tax=Lotus japonicus TaxID=34305 RepID=UPI00258C2FB2|nr:uncharacterized protein LOC130725508 [Lotus japonicus]